jgi:hypothetical protein
VLGPDTTAGWAEDRIALTALYFRGDLAVARAAVDEAAAGEMTAGAWPPFAAEGSMTAIVTGIALLPLDAAHVPGAAHAELQQG